MTRKRLILSAAATLLIAAATIALLPTAEPIFLETPIARYRVLSARLLAGTNLTFARDVPITEWYRRLGKAAGLPVSGVAGGSTFPDGQKRHLIAVLCDGRYPTNRAMQIFEEMDAECIDQTGRTIRFDSMTSAVKYPPVLD